MMDRRFIKKLLLVTALVLGAVSSSISAAVAYGDYAGSPTNTILAMNGLATNSGVSNSVDPNTVIVGMRSNGNTDANYTYSLMSAVSSNDAIYLDGVITVSGVATLYAPNGTTLNVVLNGDTVVQSADMHTTTPEGAIPSMLCFYAEQSGRINVYVNHDLTFTGSNSNQTSQSGVRRLSTDLVVTFSGTGQTRFLISDSHKVEFGSLKNTSGSFSDFVDMTSTGKGTKAYVMMDHKDADAGANGCDTVVFQRVTSDDGLPIQNSTYVAVGLNSIFTFITDNVDGSNRENSIRDAGAAAFDVSNTGSGRMVLWLKGSHGQAGSGGSYDDAAFVVRGHVVEDGLGDVSGSRSDSTTWANQVAKHTNLRRQGGYKAYVRVKNDVSRWLAGSNLTEGVFPRGLLVINENASFPALASSSFQYDGSGVAVDLWNDSSSTNCVAYNGIKKNVPVHGFILGVNGELEVGNNLFFDYVGTTTPHLFIPRCSGFTSLNGIMPAGDFGYKLHNPSALIIDGSTAETVLAGMMHGKQTYAATDRNATITLRGTGKIFLRSGTARGTTSDSNVVGSGYGDRLSTYYQQDPNDGTLSLVHTFTICTDVYDGLKVLDSSGTCEAGVYFWDDISKQIVAEDGHVGTNVALGDPATEGFHILDVEAKLTVKTVDDNYRVTQSTQVAGMPQRVLVPSTTTAAGTFNIPSVAIDASGNEFKVWGTPIAHPLQEFAYYPRYQTSSILANAEIELVSTNTDAVMTYLHNDVSRDVYYEGRTWGTYADAAPSIVGGEAAAFQQVASGIGAAYVDQSKVPLVSLYNTQFLVQESFAAAGVRFVVHDSASTPSNTSTLVFYNHGRLLDNDLLGRGRTFVLGSSINYIGDRTSTFRFMQYPTQIFSALNIFWYGNFGAELSLTTAYGQFASGQNQRSNHVLHFGPASYMSLGWTTTVASVSSYPWTNSAGNTNDQRQIAPNARLSFAGENILINGERDRVTPPTGYDENGVLYVNYGGLLTAQSYDLQLFNNENSVYPMAQIDVPLGVRIWGGDSSGVGSMSGLIEFPKDQVVVTRGVEYYNLDLNSIFSNPITSVNSLGLDSSLVVGTQLDLNMITGGIFNGDVRVSWNKVSNNAAFVAARSYDDENDSADSDLLNVDINFLADYFASANDDASYNAGYDASYDASYDEEEFLEELEELLEDVDLRATPSPLVPAAILPTGMLQVSPGQTVNQLRVAGATVASPFHLYVTGDAAGTLGIGRIYEIVSDYFINNGTYDSWAAGAGQHGCIFMDNGGRIGLGARNWNQFSNAAWNLLGKQYVTLYPNGNCVVDLNDDIIVTDNQAIIPTVNFGSDVTDARITFYSQDTHEIRIPSGIELDLSAFGQPTNFDVDESRNSQKIELGGRVRMVFEAGSVLRFPTLSGRNISQAPVLYLNDQSELVFEGTKQINKPSIQYQDLVTKIVGYGQIWVNKNASIKVFNEGLVSVATDALTPKTSVAISLARAGQFLIGDDNNAGGSFYVGNLSNVTYNNNLDTTITFSLIINGPQAQARIGRNAFLGLGVGIVDQTAGNINGYTVKSLYNVDTVTLNVLQGSFIHNELYDGSTPNGSVLAVGPVNHGYFFSLGAGILQNQGLKAYVLGGGNILYGSSTRGTTVPMSILSVEGAAGTNGNYSILGSTEHLYQMNYFPAGTPLCAAFRSRGTVLSFDSNAGASQDDFYNFLRAPEFLSERSSKIVIFGNGDVGSQCPALVYKQGPSNYILRSGAINLASGTGSFNDRAAYGSVVQAQVSGVDVVNNNCLVAAQASILATVS